MLEETYEKEYSASVNVYHPTTFNWDSLFHYQPMKPDAFHPDYFVDHYFHRHIATLFRSTKATLSNTILYPDYSKKTLGRDATRHYDRESHAYEGPKENTTRGLESKFGTTVYILSKRTRLLISIYKDSMPKMVLELVDLPK